MSDYMFMLESHLRPDQNRVLKEVQAAAAEANMNLFITGGVMRDMLGGFPIQDIDFTVEGNALKLAKVVAAKYKAEILRVDDNRKVAHLLFPGGVHATIGMARQEKFSKPGAKPQVQPSTIHDYLRGRDFTINSIALSLNPASRGLLLDPNNGAGDLEHKELRAVSNFTLYDDPVRMLRLQRFRVKLNYTLGERTKMQYDNAREAGLETKISAPALLEELRHIAAEPNVGDVLKALDEEKLLILFSPVLTGAKLNLAGLQKLQKTRQIIPVGSDIELPMMGLFLDVLTEKFSPKEKLALTKGLGLEKTDLEQWHKLEARSKKLEKELKSAKLQKASQLYQAVSKASGDQLIYLLLNSKERIVQDRIKNFFGKYLPAAQEVTDRDVTAAKGVEPGTAKFQKAREEVIWQRLDARPKKVPPPEETAPAAPLPPAPMFARKYSGRT
jgi:tRNA nucleotidyltransferase (CCA-adding enzyme)